MSHESCRAPNMRITIPSLPPPRPVLLAKMNTRAGVESTLDGCQRRYRSKERRSPTPALFSGVWCRRTKAVAPALNFLTLHVSNEPFRGGTMPSLPVNTSLPARSHLIMRDNAASTVVALKCKRKLHGNLPRGQPLRSASPYNIRKQNKNAKWRSYQKLEVRSKSSPVNVAGKASFCSSFVECFLHHNTQFLLYIRMLCIITFPRNGYR